MLSGKRCGIAKTTRMLAQKQPFIQRVRNSENYVGIIMAENLRFPGEGSSSQGKPGAKARPKGVVDAHTVEIP